MNGNKKTFSEGRMFYKEYSDLEFRFLKMLHGENDLHIDTITRNGIQYMEIPFGHVISIDTIKINHRNHVSDIIWENIPFMLKQVNLLNQLGIYYSDSLQWLLLDDSRLYLIDFDTAYFTTINYNYNNYDLFTNFLKSFDIYNKHITESLQYLQLFQETDIENTFYSVTEKEQYKHLNNPNMQKNHVYHCRNQRHIQLTDAGNYIHIYGKTGNMVITETLLNPETARNWELIRIA